MWTVVITIHLIVVLFLVALVLLQRSEGGGLGMGASGGVMSSRGTANALTRATSVLAGVFFVTSLVLGILSGSTSHGTGGVLDTKAPAAPAPGQPVGQGGSLLDQLQKQQGGTPAPAPGAPEAPKAAAPAPVPPANVQNGPVPALPADVQNAPKVDAPVPPPIAGGEPKPANPQ